MATFPYLVISDGTTTVTIADGAGGGTNYILEPAQWAPQVGGESRAALGEPYLPLAEELTLIITGATAQAAYDNLETLTALLEQADRWYRGSSDAPVELRYSPQGGTTSSTSNYLRAPIYGRPAGRASCIDLSLAFSRAGTGAGTFMIVGVRVSFARRGFWTLGTAQNVTSTSQTNGDLHTLAWGGSLLKYSSPTKLKINGVAAGLNVRRGFLILSEVVNGIAIINAESLIGTDYSSVAEGALFARNTNVLQFNPTVTTERATAYLTFTSLASTTRLVAVYANMRNTHSSISYKVRFGFRSSAVGINQTTYTPLYLLRPSTSTQWAFVGIAPLRGALQSLAALITASASGDQMSMDTIVLVDYTDRSQVIEVFQSSDVTGSSISNSNSYTINPLLDDGETYHPLLEFRDSIGNVLPMGYHGDLFLLTQAATIYAVWCGTHDSAWRQNNGGAALAGTIVADRYLSYLTPE